MSTYPFHAVERGERTEHTSLVEDCHGCRVGELVRVGGGTEVLLAGALRYGVKTGAGRRRGAASGSGRGRLRGGRRSRRGGSVPPPTAYVPVRSHRDRSSFY